MVRLPKRSSQVAVRGAVPVPPSARGERERSVSLQCCIVLGVCTNSSFVIVEVQEGRHWI